MRRLTLGLLVALSLHAAASAATEHAFPPGVSAARLEAVWTLSRTAGPKSDRQTSLRHVAPPGSRSDNLNLYLPRTGGRLDRWDLSGRAVAVDGGVFEFNDVVFRNPDAPRLLMIGERGPAEVMIRNSRFDGADMTRLFAGVVQINPGSKLTLRGCHMDNAPRLLISSAGESLTLEDCYVGAFGMRPIPEDHLEAVFVHAGRVSFRRTLFDASGSEGRLPPNTLTAHLFFKADVGPIDAELDGVVITGVKVLKGLYTIQVGAKGHPARLTIRNSAIQRGSSGYIGGTEESGGVVEVVDGGGNVDFDSGRPIKLTWRRAGR